MYSGPYINPANEAPGVKTGPAPVIKSFHRLIMEKKHFKIFFWNH